MDVFSFGVVEDPPGSGNVAVTWAGGNFVVYDCETREVSRPLLRGGGYPVPPSPNRISAVDSGVPPLIFEDGFESGDVTMWSVASGNSMLVTRLIEFDSTRIPTLNEWGLIALTGLIALFGAVALRRKKRMA